MELTSRIYVAGHSGMAGSAVVRELESRGFSNIIKRSSRELDLRNQASVAEFFKQEQPEYVFLCAGKVGGIMANNTYRADFLYDNLMIAANVIHQSWLSKVKKLLYLGSSCIYPKHALQPIKEEYLLTGTLEQTNEPYAIAKITGLKLCESYRDQYDANFIAAMPTNLYGPNDNYNLQNSHVFAALLRKMHEAKTNGDKQVTVWGSGKPFREFLHVDDLARAMVYLMENYDSREIINIGSGQELTIAELAQVIKEVTGFKGELVFDRSKPDGTPRKLMDSSRLFSTGWKPDITIKKGIAMTYKDYLLHEEHYKMG